MRRNEALIPPLSADRKEIIMKQIYQDLLNNIPDYQDFLTLEELDASSYRLAEEYPDVVTVFPIGKTREGRDLLCIKIEGGPQNAMAYGLPHPNEPIGTAMMEYFIRSLAESKELRDEVGYTWYFVKAWDADGYKLNEKWIKGPFTLYHYSRNFFRPASHQQVDWTFPIDYKELHFHSPLPETTAMMELIAQVKPAFIYSLHNAGFGGAYWYMSHQVPSVYENLHNAANRMNIPIHLGEPEVPYCVTWAPAIYQMLGITQSYDYLEKYTKQDMAKAITSGTCSADYALALCDAYTMLTELPYFYDERIKDLSPSTITRKQAVLNKLEYEQKASQFIRDMLDQIAPFVSKENPFYSTLKDFTKKGSSEALTNMVNSNPEFEKLATVAEQFDNELIAKFYKLLSFGMLVRANEYELDKLQAQGKICPQSVAALTLALSTAVSAHKELSDQLESQINYQVVPIKKLVSIQLESGLFVLEAIKNGGKEAR